MDPDRSIHLTLVVPAYNEAHRIGPTLHAYRGAFGADIEILVVANACTDDTSAVVRQVASDLGGIDLIEIAQPVGKGGAVRAGFEQARGGYVGFVDADLSFPPEEVLRVLHAAIRSGSAIGSRRLAPDPLVRRTAGRDVAGRAFATLVRELFHLPFRDTQCGIKIFHRRYLAGYLEQARVRDLAFDVELLLLLREFGAVTEEVPIAWSAQPGSPTLGSVPGFALQGTHMVRSLLRLWWRRRRRPRGAGPDSGADR